MQIRWRNWALGFLAWTVLALLSASQTAVSLTLEHIAFQWDQLLPRSLINWYSCAIFTPAFFWAARRWPIDGRSWWRFGPIHLLLCAVASALKFLVEVEALRLVLDNTSRSFASMMQHAFVGENIAFWCMAAVVHAIEFQRSMRDREVLSARLRARLSEAQLEALAARLHPHFLFNTLQAISTLVHRDPAAADAMLGHLGTLLRRMLQVRDRHEVTLAEELGLLEEYLAIAQVRFGDRLAIDREVADTALPGLVPHLLLQPLLENAFEHGIARRGGAGRVALAARRDGAALVITIRDDGVGPGAAGKEGIGLGTTRARLAELYGDAGSLRIEAAPERGTLVTVRLPFHTEPVALAATAAA